MPDWLDWIKTRIDKLSPGAVRGSEHRLQQLVMLHQVGRSISSTLDNEELLELIAANAVELLNAESASLMLLADVDGEDAPDELVVRAVAGPDPESLVGSRIPANKGIVGTVLETGQGQFYNAPHDEPLLESPLGLAIRSTLFVPLSSQGQTIGVLGVVNRSDGAPFEQEDRELLSMFVSQASAALENARLYEQSGRRLQARVDELTALQRTTQKLTATLELGATLQVVLESAVGTTGA